MTGYRLSKNFKIRGINDAVYQESTWGETDEVWWWKGRKFLWFL